MSKHRRPGAAHAKAKLLTEALRLASQLNASPQAQALLATLIAESWPAGDIWEARIGWPVLERRLGATRNTLRRWAAELDQLDLVQRMPGDGRQLTRWGLFRRGAAHAPPGGAPTHPGESTHAPPEGAPTHPVSGLSQDITQEPADDANVPKRARVVDAATKAERLRELRAQLALVNAQGDAEPREESLAP